MKKVLRNIIPVVCLLSAVSCSLDEHSYMYIQADNYMNDASEAEKVLLNVYRDMVKDEVYGYQLSLMFTLPTDIGVLLYIFAGAAGNRRQRRSVLRFDFAGRAR